MLGIYRHSDDKKYAEFATLLIACVQKTPNQTMFDKEFYLVRERGVEPPPHKLGLAPEASASAIPPLARSTNTSTWRAVTRSPNSFEYPSFLDVRFFGILDQKVHTEHTDED